LQYRAKHLFNVSTGISASNHQTTFMLKAFIEFYTGCRTSVLELTSQLLHAFREAPHVGNYVLQLQVSYARKDYQNAVKVCQRWLREQGNLPIEARVAMGYCYFHLGKFAMARACFRRIL
jgi:tetratricopeptide (TPR) repeat protein